MSNRSMFMHYGIALIGALAICLGLALGWVLRVEWAWALVLMGVAVSMFFALRSWYLGSRGFDLTPRRR